MAISLIIYTSKQLKQNNLQQNIYYKQSQEALPENINIFSLNSGICLIKKLFKLDHFNHI
jgi:hypothetical protein